MVSLSIFILKNKHREIIDGPDDKYHYLMKPANLKFCKEREMFFKNFNKYTEIDKLDEDQQWMSDRQIHRIVFHIILSILL